MMLVGQFDSPFVRRVGIALRWYGYEFEHRPLSVFGDAEEIATISPQRRVPILVLDDGTVLTESFVCLEILDEIAASDHGQTWHRLLLPRHGLRRREGLRLCAFAQGLMDKAVTLTYERMLRQQRTDGWITRCRQQFRDTLGFLERERAARPGPYLVGQTVTHADVALSCAMTLAKEALPDLIGEQALPALQGHMDHYESTEEFRATRSAFQVPVDAIDLTEA